MSVRFTPRRTKEGRLLGGLLNVRPAIARHIPPDARFEAELHDEGILFRFVGIDPRVIEDDDSTPDWTQQ